MTTSSRRSRMALSQPSSACAGLSPPDVDQTKLLRVPDSEDDCVLASMQRLANRVRRVWGGRVIGVTGSAGKTTTKECVAAVLAKQFEVLKTTGNLNNHFGVPLQLAPP